MTGLSLQDREKLLQEVHTNLIMVPYIMVSGPKKDSERAKESSSGKMVVNMKAIGRMTKQMAMGA